MAYQVLARKYRPQRFSDVAGQDHVTRTLLNALAQGRIAHGYIFSGHRGIGKTTIARILAMALNCRTAIGTVERPDAEPCGVCESCMEVRAGNAVDVIEIDAATNRGIDEIRELRDAARYRPARDKYKIYILDEAHQITDAAFNALLKTLEEPPDHVVFMMATTQPEDIPQTIRSRCQHFSFHAVKFDDILIQLRTIAAEERVGADDEALALLAEAGDGSMRDALSIMDQAIASAPLIDGEAGLDAGLIRELMGTVPNVVFERLLEAIGENQSGPVVVEINRLLNAGNSASQLARQFVRYLRNVLMARIAGEGSELLQLSPDERARAGRSSLLFSEEDLTRFLQVMLRTFDELNYRQEPRFHLELGLLKLVHLQRLLPVEQLLSQLGTAPRRLAPAASAPPALPRQETGSRAEGTARRDAAPSTGNRLGNGGSVPPPSAGSASGSRDANAGPARGPAGPTGGESARPEPTLSERPAFSPFETDSRRKGGERAAASGQVGQELPGQAGPVQSGPIGQKNAEAAVAMDTPVALDEEPARVSGPAGEWNETVAADVGVASSGDEGERAGELAEGSERVVAEPVPSTERDRRLDLIRRRLCEALEGAGHNTAAALLGSGEWVEEADGGLRVAVAAKKTMLGLAMNAEAEKICREALRSLAGGGEPPRRLTVVPGGTQVARLPDGGASRGSNGSETTAAKGSGGVAGASVQALAMENPLVKQAQELFRAEVRSVLDLRDK